MSTENKSKFVVGIDCATTYSAVAIFRNNDVEVIPNLFGNRTMPSYVAFTDTEILVGEAAKNQAGLNPQNTIFDAKRLIGRKYSDPVVQADLKHYPFKVVSKNDKPYFRVQYKGEEKDYSPEEISAMVLSKLKNIAESYLGEPVNDAVITIPAYFDNAQRQATKDAGTIAGLNVIRIINEPTAAAIAYGLNETKYKNKECIALILDCGGSTYDVSMTIIEDGLYEVKAVNGDNHLGGENLDEALMDYFVDEFKKKHKKDLKANPSAIRRLRTACERAKKKLSLDMTADVQVDCLFDGIDFESTISRAKFEDICMPVFRRILPPIDKVLQDAKMSKSDIHEVILVGGSTRIPKVQQMLKDYFNGKELNKSVNPDEAIAYGAAVQAAILSGHKSDKTKQVVILDVIPLSLGVETGRDQAMTRLIERNTKKPCKKTETFCTGADHQTECHIRIFEGERQFTKDCHLLGEFVLSGIPPLPRGQAKIEITYDVDANGILNVTAVEKSSGKTNKITITNDTNNLSKDEVERMVRDAEKNKAEDQAQKERFEAKSKLETYLYDLKQTLTTDLGKKLSDENRQKLTKAIDDEEKWVTTHPTENKVTYETRQTDLEKICDPILTSVVSSAQENAGKQMPSSNPSGPKVEEVD